MFLASVRGDYTQMDFDRVTLPTNVSADINSTWTKSINAGYLYPLESISAVDLNQQT